MNSISLRLMVAVIALLAARGTLPSPVGTARQTPLSAAAQPANVIVILRDQLPNVPPVRRSMGARMSALASSQSSLIAQLQRTRARSVRQFGTINAFATAVSPLEASALAADPLVQAVVPDRVIAPPRGKTAVKSAPTTAASRPYDPSVLCGTLEPEALQLTNAAFLNSSAAQAQRVVDDKGQAITGQGVKVAFLADGMDPALQGFIRPDGSRVFIDYQNFSGDAAGTPTGDGEGFGAASAIAAQDMPNGKPLLFDISQFVNPAHPLPAPCNIQIRGIAPGASLVGLDVVSSLGLATTSRFVQAIEYAVVHDDVDVINEPFGGNPVPDTTEDPISLANDAAVSAGVTVVVGTGDAGPAGTLGASATPSDVIAVGTSTAYRIYEQISYGAQALAKGYLSNNISSLSSGGFAQRDARTVDVVAPGDFAWSLCSTNLALYGYCTNLTAAAAATPIQAFGGSGEASPMTAGEAALVIQAYRSSHGGTDPTPAIVKQIIMSSATDLGAPSSEQGAGLINALLAVHTALSNSNGLPKIFSNGSNIGHSSDRAVTDLNRDLNPKPQHAGGVLYQPNSAHITDAVHDHESLQFQVSNTGSATLRLTPTLQVLGAAIAGASHMLTLAPATDPTFVGPTGTPLPYITQKFEVPAGAQHLDAAIAYRVNLASTIPGPAPGIVSLALLDPQGRQVAYSLPQSMFNGYGQVDVVKPLAGTWTALIWAGPPGNAGYPGAVQFSWSAEKFVRVGTVSPASLILAPGATQTLIVSTPIVTQPGDLAAAIRFDQPDHQAAASLAAIPVSLRTLIPIGPTGGSFSGTLTGGNGASAPTQTFELIVPAGVNDLNLELKVADPDVYLQGFLADPQGNPLSDADNISVVDGSSLPALEIYREHPQAGTWHFVLSQNSPGINATSQPFTGKVAFDTARVTVPGLPNNPSTVLSSGTPVSYNVNITNTGVIPQAYFIDARLPTPQLLALPSLFLPCGSFFSGAGCPVYYVPTQITALTFSAQSSIPITMDASSGATDIFAAPVGANSVTATFQAPEVPYGGWLVSVSPVGPFGAAGAPSEPVTTTATALLKPFDFAVTSFGGDFWLSVAYGDFYPGVGVMEGVLPTIILPGATGVIQVTITPDPSQLGKAISGYLYVDTLGLSEGGEVVRIPYSYTVGP
jgi:Subtilase family